MGGCSSKESTEVVETHDISMIDIDSLENDLGDIGFVKDVLTEMRVDTKKHIDNLYSSILSNDVTAIILSSHSIKGIALSTKCSKIAKISTYSEDKCREAQTTNIDVTLMRTSVDKLQEEVTILNKFQEKYCA